VLFPGDALLRANVSSEEIGWRYVVGGEGRERREREKRSGREKGGEKEGKRRRGGGKAQGDNK
jgi:hypothetical protein